MLFKELWTLLRETHEALSLGGIEFQADAVNRVFLFAHQRRQQIFPGGLSRQIDALLQWYLSDILPNLGYAEADASAIAAEYHALLECRNSINASAEQIETQFEQMLLRLRSHRTDYLADAIRCLLALIEQTPGMPPSVQLPAIAEFVIDSCPTLEEFTCAGVSRFVNALFAMIEQATRHTPLQVVKILSDLRHFCEYLVESHFQAKALLVDTFFRGHLLPIWVEIDMQRSSEHVRFWNFCVDAAMQTSADAARAAARHYLRAIAGIELPENMVVECRLPYPGIHYYDTSASLLISLKIVGEVLGLSNDPTTAVTGEIDSAGNIGPVKYLPQKIKALSEYPALTRLLAPAANRDMLAALAPEYPSVRMLSARTLSEAVEVYYDYRPQAENRPISRRQMLIGSASVLAIPAVMAGARLFGAPAVTEQDIWNLEYAIELYSKQNNYVKAREILRFILQKFVKETASPSVRHLTAQAYEELGWTYTFQYQKQASVMFLQRSLELWRSLNDREKQAHLLILIGSVLGDGGDAQYIRRNAAYALRSLHAAQELIHPAMSSFHALQGKYHSKLGLLYCHLGQYALAEDHTRRSLGFLRDGNAAMPRYAEIMEQHLGRVLGRQARYDLALETLGETVHSPLLQSPSDQARSYRTLSDLFFSIGDVQKGVEYLKEAMRLAQAYHLEIQLLGIKITLARHQIAPSALA